MFIVDRDWYIKVDNVKRVRKNISFYDAGKKYYVRYDDGDSVHGLYCNSFEQAVAAFTKLLQAIGVDQEEISSLVEESRQKIEEQKGN